MVLFINRNNTVMFCVQVFNLEDLRETYWQGIITGGQWDVSLPSYYKDIYATTSMKIKHGPDKSTLLCVTTAVHHFIDEPASDTDSKSYRRNRA